MKDSMTIQVPTGRETSGLWASVKLLVGSGDEIGRFVLPFILLGGVANIVWPAVFQVGGPSDALRIASIVALVPGVVIWAWSVALILTYVPRGQLITSGPFSLVKHPLYTSVALLVLPWVGFLLNSWLGLLIGAALYIAERLYAPAEERALAEQFGAEWDEYGATVKLPWL